MFGCELVGEDNLLGGWKSVCEDGLLVLVGEGDIKLVHDVYFSPSAKVPMMRS